MAKRIAVIPGDGIGAEVTAEATKVLDTLARSRKLSIECVRFDWGAEKYLREGITLPEGALDMFRREFDAVFIGALGDPRVPDMKHAADILLGIRFGLDLYVNQRPVKLLDARLCPLKVRERYPEIDSSHLYVDTLAMEMVRNPAQFKVIVTCNMFGDILSDLGAELQGGLGLAPSANLYPGKVSMFEPVHGSAPKYAGKNLANPMAAILSVGMMLENLGFPEEATRIESAVSEAIRQGKTTPDLAGSLGTREVGDWICSRL